MFFATWKPATDIFYSGNRWVIRIELAGILSPEVQIQAQSNSLSVIGQRRDTLLQQDYTCLALEISYACFERTIYLPAEIITSSIHWEFRNGILQIELDTFEGR